MITDKSGIPAVGLALLRANLAKLTPTKSVELKGKMLVVVGPEESFESASFPPGSAALATALELLGPICSPEAPCCDRRDEYNGFNSGTLKFVCPKHCRCHD